MKHIMLPNMQYDMLVATLEHTITGVRAELDEQIMDGDDEASSDTMIAYYRLLDLQSHILTAK